MLGDVSRVRHRAFRPRWEHNMPRLAAKNGVILNLAAVLVFAGGCLALLQLATEGAYAAEPLRRLRRAITSTTAPTSPVTTTTVE